VIEGGAAGGGWRPRLNCAPHDAGMRAHAMGELFRRHGAVVIGHVEKAVEHGGEAGVAFHVTLMIT
jgi:hypothetical protein